MSNSNHRTSGKIARTARRDNAEVRIIQAALRTPEQQLDELDRRLGVCVGAFNERSRLQIAMDA